MIRRIITIDEEKCNGCGICADACHEGAIGLVGGKAQLLREDLRWLGLDWDGETPAQSTRSHVYDHYFQQLQEMDLLYPCYCTRSQLHSVNAPHLSDGT